MPNRRPAVRKRVVIMNRLRILRVTAASVLAFAQIVIGGSAVPAQTITTPQSNLSSTNLNFSLVPDSAVARYEDPQSGLTVDQAVAYALEHNGELQSARKEIDAASALVKQAALRANPKVDAS